VKILHSSWAEREPSFPLNRFSHNLVLSILHARVAQAIQVAIGWQQEGHSVEARPVDRHRSLRQVARDLRST
jgi:hypothetical protein